MKNEQLENAIKRGWVEHHIGNKVLNDDEVKNFNPLPSENFKEGFIAGYEWRINSVWHDKKEKPVCKGERKFCDIFYISKKGYPRTNTYSESGFLLYRGEEWRDVKYWAYVNDLLPTKGGAE